METIDYQPLEPASDQYIASSKVCHPECNKYLTFFLEVPEFISELAFCTPKKTYKLPVFFPEFGS
jgi:hypothetical protein